jgi:hypothetical protein
MAKFRIYYPARNMIKTIGFLFDGDGVTAENLRDTHRMVCILESPSLEQCFDLMQGENWSPNGEAWDLIEALGVTHTSMSVGDVAVDENDNAHLVMGMGWKNMGKLPERRR